MTNLKGKLPSPKGLIRKIFKNGKVIGLLLTILISIFSVFIIRTYIDIKTENANVIVQAKGISLEKQVLDDHVKTIEAKGYENVVYELNKVVETIEKMYLRQILKKCLMEQLRVMWIMSLIMII